MLKIIQEEMKKKCCNGKWIGGNVIKDSNNEKQKGENVNRERMNANIIHSNNIDVNNRQPQRDEGKWMKLRWEWKKNE